MRRGELYRSEDRVPERGGKPGYYVVVSRDFIARNDDVATVVCAPVYSRILGLATEVELGKDDGLPKDSAARCDFLTLMWKASLTRLVGSLSPVKMHDLDRALTRALGIGEAVVTTRGKPVAKLVPVKRSRKRPLSQSILAISDDIVSPVGDVWTADL